MISSYGSSQHRQIYCLGDSTTAGCFDRASGGWVNRLAIELMLRESDNHELNVRTQVFNLGIGGETVDGALNRYEPEILTRAYKKSKGFLLLQYGMNDCVIHKNKNRVPIEIFVNKITTIIEWANSKNISPIVLALYQVAGDANGMHIGDGEQRYIADITRYNEALKNLATVRKVDYLSWTSEALDRTILSNDGYHLNAGGHEKVFKAVLQFFDSRGY